MARRPRLVVLAASATALAVLGASPAATAAAPRFGKPVLLTTGPVGGYEPGIVVDKFGNVVVTAHKNDHAIAAAPDSRSPTGVRAMSWVWWSRDGGRTFANMPGATALDEQNAVVGAEGDLAVDATGHVYFVDTHLTDVSVTRWRASGRGEMALEHVRPVGPTGAIDDRPWIVAHGDGVVLYVASTVYKGNGRIVAHMSYDHGETFDPVGYSLPDSFSCTPMADQRRGSRTFYVVCSDYERGHWAFATHDDGRTWSRHLMGRFQQTSWINGAVGPDGTVYALYHDGDANGTQGGLVLYTSKDRGRTWRARDVTAAPGNVAHSWMDVAPDGTIGIAYYYSPDGTRDWNIWAGVAKPGRRFTYAKVAPGMPLMSDHDQRDIPWGDFFQVAFDRESRLHVVWTSDRTTTLNPDDSDIYYARQAG